MRSVDELLCFDLYAASRAVTGLYRPLLEPLGLTYPQCLVLTALPVDEIRTVGELAARLDLDHGTLSPLLRRMEAAGLLERRRATRDERVVELRLTEAGADLRRRVPDVQCAVEESLGLDPDALADLQRTLKRLTAEVRARADSEVSDR